MSGDDRGGWPEVPGYRLLSVLGQGGFATVYRARQDSVGRDVAVKVLASGALDPTTARRLHAEVVAIGRLSDHPHVVALFDAGATPGGLPFISMQLVEDGSFGDRIEARGPLDPATVARVGAEVADALDAAHEAGILHRDVKPDNVLIGRRERALVSDFGIAKLLDATRTATGSLTGTLAYTAPELLRGGRPSPASDVFSLGATLHALATGRSPFAGDDDHIAAVIWRIANDDPPPLPASVPPVLAAVVADCLAKDPAERPGIAEVRSRLSGVDVGPAPPLAPPTPPPPPPPAGPGGVTQAVRSVPRPPTSAVRVRADHTLAEPPAPPPPPPPDLPPAAVPETDPTDPAGDAADPRGHPALAVLFFGVVALALGGGLLWALTGGPGDAGGGASSTTTATTEAVVTTADPTGVVVGVVNTTSVVGLASAAADELAAAGYETAFGSDRDDELRVTEVYATPGSEAAAASVAGLLGLTDVTVQDMSEAPLPQDIDTGIADADVDVLVLLGTDAA